MIHISQKLTHNEELYPLPLVAAEEEEVEGGEKEEEAAAAERGGGVEAETILPPSGPPRWSHGRSRSTSKAPPSESRCQGNVAPARHIFL